jgi:DNA topoisomerase-2
LVVSHRKKADIVEYLRQKKFHPFLKVTTAKATGETEDAEDGANNEAKEATMSGALPDYDYLLVTGDLESHEREGLVNVTS